MYFVQVPIGPRITAANHLSSNVSSWGHTIARSNSGTACKQWLVVDFNKMKHVGGGHSDKDTITETMLDELVYVTSTNYNILELLKLFL